MSGTNDPYDPKEAAALAPEVLEAAAREAEKAFAEASDLDAYPRDLLDQVRLEKIGARRPAPIDHCEVVTLNLRNATLLIDLHLITRRVPQR